MLLYCFIKKNKYLLFLNHFFMHRSKLYLLPKLTSFYKILRSFFIKKNELFNIQKIKNTLLLHKKHPILYTKTLLMRGRGYKCFLDHDKRLIILKVGYSHSIRKFIPSTVKINLRKNKVVFKSLDHLILQKYSLAIKMTRKISSYKKKGLFFAKDSLKFKQVKKK